MFHSDLAKANYNLPRPAAIATVAGATQKFPTITTSSVASVPSKLVRLSEELLTIEVNILNLDLSLYSASKDFDLCKLSFVHCFVVQFLT